MSKKRPPPTADDIALLAQLSAKLGAECPSVRWYRLDGHTPVPCTFMEHVQWKDQHGEAERIVARTRVHGVVVSTVFLMLDHYLGINENHVPVLFETMRFREDGATAAPFYNQQQRYCTWDEAIAGHKAIVAELKAAVKGWKAQVKKEP